MKLVDLAREVLSEHDSLLSEWKSLNQLILRVREIDEKRPRSKESFYEAYKDISDLYSKMFLFMSKFTLHELKEESYLYPDLNERGKLHLTMRLMEDHRRLNLLLEELRKALDDYRYMKIEEWELRERAENVNEQMNSILAEHIKIEHEEFSQIK